MPLLAHCLLILCFSTSSAYAYIDPGTGSMVVQTLIALGISFLFFLRHPKQAIQRLLDFFKHKK